jgi:hypothetical protein
MKIVIFISLSSSEKRSIWKNLFVPKTYHPKLFPDHDKINTVVFEQVNCWLGSFKHIVNCMNFYRFNFFLFIMMDMNNQAKIDNKISNAEKFILYIFIFKFKLNKLNILLEK